MSSDQTFGPSQFQASQVPKYPVYQLFYENLADDDGQAADRAVEDRGVQDRLSRVELDGIRVEPAAGQPLREAAIAAIAKKASDQQRTAVRVVVTTGDTGEGPSGRQRFKMIVTADGEAIDLSDTETTASKPAGKKTPLVVGGLVLVLAAATAGVTAVVLNSDDATAENTHTTDTGLENTGSEGTGTDEEAAPEREAPNAGAQVPVGLPDEYSATASWVTPVAEDSGVLELADDTLVFIDPDGALQAIDPETAQPLWHATDAPDSMEDLHETTWAGQPVLAEADSQSLKTWPIPDTHTDEPVQPESIELTHQAEVSFVGDSPLIDLGDYIVAADAGDGSLTEVEIPAGAEPLFVSAGEVISMDDTHLYHSPVSDKDQDSDSNESTQSVELSHHNGVQNDRPQAVWALTDEIIAGLYQGEDEEPLVQLFSADSEPAAGERLTSSYVDTAPGEQDQAQVDAEAQTAVIGSVGIQWGNEPAVTNITAPRDPLLHETTLWGSGASGANADGPARLDITDEDAEPQPYEVFSDEDPPPVLVTEDAAYLEAPRVDQTLLYRAEHQPTVAETEESPETDPTSAEVSSDEEQDEGS